MLRLAIQFYIKRACSFRYIIFTFFKMSDLHESFQNVPPAALYCLLISDIILYYLLITYTYCYYLLVITNREKRVLCTRYCNILFYNNALNTQGYDDHQLYGVKIIHTYAEDRIMIVHRHACGRTLIIINMCIYRIIHTRVYVVIMQCCPNKISLAFILFFFFFFY